MDIEQIQAAARRKLEEEQNQRVNAVKDVAEIAKRTADLRAELKDAEKQHATAWRSALRHGWTDSELRGFGLAAPSTNLGGRPKRTAPAKAEPSETADTSPMVQD